MPWNDNQGGGQGPWGSGGGNNNGQNPWGQRPNGGGGGGGDQPPDLDEVVRQMQDSLGRMFGGKGGGAGGDGKKGGGGGIFGLGGIILALLVIWSALPQTGAWYVVDTQQAGVVLRFGEYNRTTGPGLNLKLPAPIEQVFIPDVDRANNFTVGSGANGQMLTRDENIVDIDFEVQWRVDSRYPEGVRDYLFNVRNPEATVRAIAESAMREVIGTSDYEFITTTGRSEVTQRTQMLLQETLDEYRAGIEITQVNLATAQAPASVIEAFRDVDVAEQDAERSRQDAQLYRRSTLEAARGRAAQLTEEAEAYRARVVEEAQGQADRFISIYEQYEQAPDVTRRRMYLETMERVLSRSDLVVLDGDVGAVPYLPVNELGQNRSNSGGQ